jgi:ABC-type multidrug transport system ATPase subunit
MGMEDDGTPMGDDVHLLHEDEIKPALIIRSLSAEVGPRSYPRHLLEDVSAFLYEKEIMVVLGGSGAGKTTLLRSLVAQREDRGRVRYIGDVFTRPYTRIGYLDEDNLLLGNLTVKETLQYSALLDMPGLNDRRVAARVNQWMDRFKLQDVANTPVRQLSSGLRKGLQIAQLLVRSCNLLVLDEPLTGIDSSTAMSIMTELRNLVDSTRINVILSMHQPWEGVSAVPPRNFCCPFTCPHT